MRPDESGADRPPGGLRDVVYYDFPRGNGAACARTIRWSASCARSGGGRGLWGVSGWTQRANAGSGAAAAHRRQQMGDAKIYETPPDSLRFPANKYTHLLPICTDFMGIFGFSWAIKIILHNT